MVGEIVRSNNGIDKNTVVSREAIVDFENLLRKVPGALVGNNDSNPLKHYFGDSVYGREMYSPAGMCLTGKIHKYDHIVILLKGELTIASEEGGIQHLKAPTVFVSSAGAKRAIHCKTDCRLITVHRNPSNTHEIKKLEEELVCDTFEEFEQKQIVGNEIKNCGLIALQQMCGIKNISAPTLIALAKDNGIELTGYKVGVNEINDSLYPAILHSENHFVFVDKGQNKPDLKYTGNIFSSNKLNHTALTHEELKNINGSTFIAIATAVVGGGAAVFGAIKGGQVATQNKQSAEATAAAAKAQAEAAVEVEKLKIEQEKIKADAAAKRNKQTAIYIGAGVLGLMFLGTLIWIFSADKK